MQNDKKLSEHSFGLSITIMPKFFSLLYPVVITSIILLNSLPKFLFPMSSLSDTVNNFFHHKKLIEVQTKQFNSD